MRLSESAATRFQRTGISAPSEFPNACLGAGYYVFMPLRRTFVWLAALLILVAGAGAASLWLGSAANTSALGDAALGVSIVAAVGVLVAVAVALLGNEHQRQLAKDVKRLAELTESSLEEARAQRPEPVVGFVIQDGFAQEAVWSRSHDARPIDAEAIIASERALAMATLPAPTPSDRDARSLEGLFGASTFAMLGLGPITDEERSDFAKGLDEYLKSLKSWLGQYDAWRKRMPLIFSGKFQFSNNGRVPARDTRVYIDFPDSFRAVGELPELPQPPRRLRFRRRTFQDLIGATTFPNLYRPLGASALGSLRRSNVTGPTFGKGSLRVGFKIEKLLHGVPEVNEEAALIIIEHDGAYTIPWEIHAENLSEPATGKLTLQVESRTQEGPAITSLDEIGVAGNPEVDQELAATD